MSGQNGVGAQSTPRQGQNEYIAQASNASTLWSSAELSEGGVFDAAAEEFDKGVKVVDESATF